MNFKIIAFALSCIFINQVYAAYDETKDPYYKDALSAATSAFLKYAAVCNGKTYVRTSENSFWEFNEPPKVKLLGVYPVSDSERLNGTAWHGRFVIRMGGAVRSVDISTNEISRWMDTSGIDFNFLRLNNEWQIEGKVWASLNHMAELQPQVSCEKIPHH